MSGYISRIVDNQLDRLLKTFGAVLIEGPRSAGKTVTAQHHAKSELKLDYSGQLLEIVQLDPSFALEGESPRLIDEWQLAPGLWNAARHAIDENSEAGLFIFTGSAVPADDITRHSGAGRFGRLHMRTMSLQESADSCAKIGLADILEGRLTPEMGGGPSVEEYAELIVRGGWPLLVKDGSRSAEDYLEGYLESISRVDLPQAGIALDPLRMKALIRALARNVASETAITKIAVESGVSPQSARAYVDALTRIFVVEELPAWSISLRSKVRMRVQPKWHFVDPSLAVCALGANRDRLLSDLNSLGFLFESLCIRDLRIYAQAVGAEVSHYRDNSGLEIDAIMHFRDGNWAAFEVKLGGKESVTLASKNLHRLNNKIVDGGGPAAMSLNVITAGNLSYPKDDGVNVIALGHLGV